MTQRAMSFALSSTTTQHQRKHTTCLPPLAIPNRARSVHSISGTCDPRRQPRWRERYKLPAPDAELATGPVWLAGTIEPLLAAGGPQPRVPGQRLRKFQVTARMIAGPYPTLTNDRRSNFQAAIAATHRTSYLKPPTARWEMLNEAVVTIECEAHES